MDSNNFKHQFLYFFLISAIGSCTSASSPSHSTEEDSEVLMIKEQGSFLVGGSVKTAPGTFDPIEHGYLIHAIRPRRGKRCTAITLMFFINIR